MSFATFVVEGLFSDRAKRRYEITPAELTKYAYNLALKKHAAVVLVYRSRTATLDPQGRR